MQKIYKECQRRGISTIFCCGDVTDGYYPDRSDCDRVVKYNTADKQAEYVANIHPYDPDIKFYMIGGNHDITHKYNEGIDVCEKINLLRSISTLPILFIIVIFFTVNLVNPYIISRFIEFLNKLLCKIYLNEKTLKKIDISLARCDTVISIL